MIPMLEPRHVGEVLGGHRVLGKPMTSILELNDAVERGLPKATLRNVARHVFSDAADQRAMMHRIVPEATYKRRRSRRRLYVASGTIRCIMARWSAASEKTCRATLRRVALGKPRSTASFSSSKDVTGLPLSLIHISE